MVKTHKSATASHYNNEADSYDTFNENKSREINLLIAKILEAYKVKKVLDLSCGTGSQVFYLSERGYEVIGVDINDKMLKIAKEKALKYQPPLSFLKGDMRTSKVGSFDAVLTIFNAIGHLTKDDFAKTLMNVNHNLKKGGIYVFDIFNLSYLLDGNNITKLTIDWQEKAGNVTFREVQYSTIDQDGVLTSYDILHRQESSNPPQIKKTLQTLQVYSFHELEKMLLKAGFRVVNSFDALGSPLTEKESERIFIVAQKN